MNDLTDQIVELAARKGFDRCAVAAVEDLPAALRLEEWLSAGMHGSMQWMARNPRRRSDPREVVAGARSVLVVALNYYVDEPSAEAALRGRISRYAWGNEYHRVVGDRLEALLQAIRRLLPEVEGRWYVDTGPVMEKAWAQRAGLGWVGKHSNLISRELGSWLFLGAIVLDVALQGGEAHADFCGTCTACIDACPTDAIVAPYVVDARRCISYLTIENRGEIPIEFRPLMGNLVFGCDICQDVCPWNRFAQPTHLPEEFGPRELNRTPFLAELLRLGDEEFRERYRDSPIRRAKRRGLARNVAVALGNSGDEAAVLPLVDALQDEDALVRAHAAWALGELGTTAANSALEARRQVEEADSVNAEIAAALARRTDRQSPRTAS